MTKHVYCDHTVREGAWHRPHDLPNKQHPSVSETPSAQITLDFTEATEIVYARRFVVVANVRSSCAPVLETHTRL